ncbi:hypothetical protein F5X98DRAFT_391450 [Xylaria grammica]|nr:hypothetical protein F5X98DRAFT_391450 [Xylaria grammica]
MSTSIPSSPSPRSLIPIRADEHATNRLSSYEIALALQRSEQEQPFTADDSFHQERPSLENGFIEVQEDELFHPDGHVGKPTSPATLWRSAWLKKRTLLGFVVVFSLVWIGLIILWHYGQQDDGIAITLSRSHYSWKYGPTVIVTILLTLWRRVDYDSKLIQPWREMEHGPVDSSKSLLLDYISPVQIITIYRSCRHRHWGTALSILTFTLLKLAMLLSTLLLISAANSYACTYPVHLTTTINGSRFWGDLINNNGDILLDPSRPLGAVPDRPQERLYSWNAPELIHAYQGIASNNVVEPEGLQGGVVFQSYDIDNLLATNNLTRISTSVDAFISNITCEESSITFQNGTLYGTIEATNLLQAVALDSSTCSAGHFAATVGVQTCHTNCPSYQESLNFLRVNCSESRDIVKYKDWFMYDIDQYQYDLRLALIAMNSSYEEVLKHNTNGKTTKYWAMTSNKVAAVVCKFDYNYQSIMSTMDPLTATFEIDIPNHSPSAAKSLNLTNLQMGEFLFSALLSADTTTNKSGGIWDLVRANLGGYRMGSEFLFDAGSLANTTATVFSGLSAQFIHQRWLSSSSIPANGTGVCHENRLYVQSVPLWLMVALFILMSLLPALMTLVVSETKVPANPGSIAALSTILASSPSLLRLLERAGSLRTSELEECLSSHVFQTEFNHSQHFGVIATENAQLHDGSNARNTERGTSLTSKYTRKGDSWVPLGAASWFLALAFLFPIVSIGGLEALYQYSRTENGLAMTSKTSLYLTQYGTSILILIIVTMFNSVDFSIQSCLPYYALSAKRQTGGIGMVDNFLDKLPPVALYVAIRKRYFGSALSNITTILAGVLAIISSGLWTVQPATSTTTEVSTSPSTTWDLTWHNSAFSDGGAAHLVDSVDQGAANSSEGIWGNLVFPHLDAVHFIDDTYTNSVFNSTGASFQFTVPALRPVLACDVVPKQNLRLSVVDMPNYAHTPSVYVTINTTIDLPEGCFGGLDGRSNYLSFNQSTPIDITNWYGWIYDARELINTQQLHPGPPGRSRVHLEDAGDYTNATRFLGVGSVNQPDSPNGCPSVVVTFAHLDARNVTKNTITVLSCSQMIQEVLTEVSLSFNETGRIGQHSLLAPPITNESTIVYLTNGTEGIHSFNYRIEPHLYNYLTPSGSINKGWNINPFFNHIVTGYNPVPLESMLGPDNVDSLKEAVNAQYQRYMVEVINNRIFRKPVDKSSLADRSEHVINGTATAYVSRLAVDYASKLALQILLAIIVALEALALTQIRFRGLLPRSPCSIASVAALLAGSGLGTWDFIPQKGGTSQKQLAEVFAPYPFRMGWWHWRDDITTEEIDTGDGEEIPADCSRFGIDIGEPVRLGFNWKEKRVVGNRSGMSIFRSPWRKGKGD